MRNSKAAEEIISVGIDIGTSTTKLVISRFSLMNMAGTSHVPRIEIIDKEVIYESPIFRTPLLSATEIDMNEVEKLVVSQYEKAGISAEEIKTGAVIITGETATKSNAQEMIHHLSDHAGEFLVATAGPDLEGIIAAKGSGAHAYSEEFNKTIANIDIGGGTANTAVYRNGELLGTCTLHIGGKLIEMRDDRIQYISPALENVCSRLGVSLEIGSLYAELDSKKITDYMASVIARMLRKELTDADKDLLLGHEPSWEGNIDTIMFSGGVSECIYKLEKNDEEARAMYGDIGMLLASSLTGSTDLSEWQWLAPNETVRATVLGAGTQTTEISGVTIQVDTDVLPLKNLPVYNIDFTNDFEHGMQKLPALIEEGVQIFDPNREGQNFALYLSDVPLIGFRDIQRLARTIVEAAQKKPVPRQPLVIVLERDLAKALGQTINTQYKEQSAVCVDQIRVEHGDYLDIGRLLQSGVVPVVVKTLAFH
ncbi:ethanolamine ammonia-lyase reactivating factor EutA [Bacillus piscicola]|uniref:ethanolamine ammonia-lyase reactivating factor EutA n=1 Tax=Bacillus piscicola TaxID=1632684 RepID=UPI001F095DE3|nr:ethanolamine ammonia-lyase reactivating factor EutA [Bacillus piscicola]